MIEETRWWHCERCGNTENWKRPNARCPECNYTFSMTEKVTVFIIRK